MPPRRQPARSPGADLPKLRDALPVQLLRARESVMAWFRPNLRDHGVTDHQWRVLRALAEAPALEMQELAAICHVHPPSLSRIMPILAQRGLLSRGNDPDDQRRVVAELTPAGRRLVASASAESHRIYEELTATFGAERLASLQAALDEVISRLDRRRAAAGSPQEAAAERDGARA